MTKFKSIMVTGGCGFMGSHFVDFLLSSDVEQVVIIDKLTYAGNVRNIERALEDKRAKFHLGDIADPLISHIMKMEHVDCIVNFAAETHVDRSITHPKAFLETDIMGVFNLAYFSMKNGIKLFLQISTDEVYGPMLEGEATEDFPLNPTSPYSASKAAAELLLRSYHKTYGLPLIIVRCCNNFGPRQYPEKLVPMAITRALDNKKVLMHGEGKESREWIYVEDCVLMIQQVLFSGKSGEIFNIGSGIRLDNARVIAQIILGARFPRGYCIGHDEAEILFGEWVEKVPNRPNNDFRYALCSDKIRKEIYNIKSFGYEYFEIKLDKTIQWYKDFGDWWKGAVDLDSNFYKEGESLR